MSSDSLHVHACMCSHTSPSYSSSNFAGNGHAASGIGNSKIILLFKKMVVVKLMYSLWKKKKVVELLAVRFPQLKPIHI